VIPVQFWGRVQVREEQAFCDLALFRDTIVGRWSKNKGVWSCSAWERGTGGQACMGVPFQASTMLPSTTYYID
jgi:hypothetical protein